MILTEFIPIVLLTSSDNLGSLSRSAAVQSLVFQYGGILVRCCSTRKFLENFVLFEFIHNFVLNFLIVSRHG